MHDALRDSFHDRCLADARLADEHRVVLRAAREHLHHTAHLFITADDGVDLAELRHLREVARVLLERLEFSFWLLVRHALRAADFAQRREDLVAREAHAAKELLEIVILLLGDREQDVLGRGVLVLEAFGLRPCLGQHFVRAPIHRGLCAALHLRHRCQTLVDAVCERRSLHARLLHNGPTQATFLHEEREHKVLGIKLWIAHFCGNLLCCHERFTRLGGQSIETHIHPLLSTRAASQTNRLSRPRS